MNKEDPGAPGTGLLSASVGRCCVPGPARVRSCCQNSPRCTRSITFQIACVTPFPAAPLGLDLGRGDRTRTDVERWLDGDGPSGLALSNTGLSHLLKHSIPVGQGSPERLRQLRSRCLDRQLEQPVELPIAQPGSRLSRGSRLTISTPVMSAQPVLDRCSFAVWRKIHDAATLQVAQDRFRTDGPCARPNRRCRGHGVLRGRPSFGLAKEPGAASIDARAPPVAGPASRRQLLPVPWRSSPAPGGSGRFVSRSDSPSGAAARRRCAWDSHRLHRRTVASGAGS